MDDERDRGLGSVSGLPDELGIDDDLARADQRATVRVESRRYGKPVTVVEGLDPNAIDLTELASRLKRALAVGGTVEDGRIELQGDHAKRVPNLLREEGFEVA
ncbi:MAG: stress response translation initiation inhibitor YciH [Halalkalicoccus sp.]